MRIDVLGAVAVSTDRGSITGQALGGRRARVALAALALSTQTVPADRLASMIWPDNLARLLATAAFIRERADRAAPVSLQGAVNALRLELGTTSVAPLEVDAAGRLATALLSAVTPPRHMSLR